MPPVSTAICLVGVASGNPTAAFLLETLLWGCFQPPCKASAMFPLQDEASISICLIRAMIGHWMS